MKKKLKLFVWEDFCSDYTPGLAVALAETVEEAREMLYNMYRTDYMKDNLYGNNPSVYDPATDKVSFYVMGGS